MVCAKITQEVSFTVLCVGKYFYNYYISLRLKTDKIKEHIFKILLISYLTVPWIICNWSEFLHERWIHQSLLQTMGKCHFMQGNN